MSWYYIDHEPNEVDHQKLYSFYKEDLELVYPTGYSIECSDKIERSMDSQFLPYLLIDGSHIEVHLSGDKENWKEQIIKSGKYSDGLIIKPITMEEYENDFAPIIYYVRVRDKTIGTKTMIIFSAYKQDLEAMYPGYEIFISKYDYSFNRLYIQALPYILEIDGKREVLDKPSWEPNWKEELIKKISHEGKEFLIYPYPVASLFEDYNFMAEEWRKSLGGKSVLQHLADIVQDNKSEDSYEDDMTQNVDNEFNSSDPNYCKSCGSSPCMCSDPERTSTLNF